MIRVLLFLLAAASARACIDDRFIESLAVKETGGRTGLIGDKHLREYSYGRWQIRRVYLEDVKRLRGRELEKAGYKNPGLEDVRKDDRLGRLVVELYLGYYGKAYEKKTGRALTPEVAFMIHNGGPRGWDKGVRHHPAARAYAASAMSIYRKTRG